MANNVLDAGDLMVIVADPNGNAETGQLGTGESGAPNDAQRTAGAVDDDASKLNICCGQKSCPPPAERNFDIDDGVTTPFFRKRYASDSCPCKRRFQKAAVKPFAGKPDKKRPRIVCVPNPQHKSIRQVIKDKLKHRDAALLYKHYLEKLLASIGTLQRMRYAQEKSRHSCIGAELRPPCCNAVKRITDQLEDLEIKRYHIPAHMGWDWKKDVGAKRKGWFPGAIPRNIRSIMAHFLPGRCPVHGCRMPPTTCPSTPKLVERNCPAAACDYCGGPGGHQNHPCAVNFPVRFRVDQANMEQQTLSLISQIKNTLKQKGYGRCLCRQSLDRCVCRDCDELQRLLQFVAECEQHYGVPCLANRIYLDDLDDMTLEFTPPAGLPPPRRCRPPFKCKASVETQYDEIDYKGPEKRVSSSASGGGAKKGGKAKGKGGKKDKKGKGKKAKGGKKGKKKK